MALVDRLPRKPPKGVATPRIAPPIPAKSLIADYEAAAADLGIKLMPWQKLAARYITGGTSTRAAFRAVCIVVARQNGKTELLLPFILMNLQQGRRILHTAQNRALPRETFLRLAAVIETLDRKAKVKLLAGPIRYANGQEVIKFGNGGRYTLVAPRPGVRGNSVDVVLLDEVREQRSFDLIAGIKPTMTASKNPQIIYLSNAGDSDSIVLNDLRRKADTDDGLAYLEWSASPERSIDDHDGWAEANPALGITIQPETLVDFHGSLPGPVFETEHLCRWVVTMQPRLVAEGVWLHARSELEPRAIRPMMGVSMDANGRRASGVIAWQQSDGTIGLRVVADVTGEPIDADALAKDLRVLSIRLGVPSVGFDPLTDAALAKHFRDPKSITGTEFANASATFVRLLNGGQVRWDDAEQITDDLTWTARRPYEGLSGAWKATKAKEDRPITAVLAAIRAVSLASGPKPSVPKVS